MTIESITVDAEGRLYVPDNVSGNIYRVDPSSPRPTVVGRVAARPNQAMANSNGLAFDRYGDLFIAKGAFNEVLRIRKGDLNADLPGNAMTYATGAMNANGLVFDRSDNLFVSGTATGNIYRVRPGGGPAEVVVHRDAFFPNGLAFDDDGTLYISDTQRGEIWKAKVTGDGDITDTTLFVRDALLQRVDGIAFDSDGTLWCTVQTNSIVTVTRDRVVRQVAHNDSNGPLEVPTAIVFVGPRAYVNNHDTVAPPNGDGRMSNRGVGASIAEIIP